MTLATLSLSQPQPNNQPVTVYLRDLCKPDLPNVLPIEREGFENPWTKKEFIRCLRCRNNIGMVAEVSDRIVGFMIYELYKTHLDLLNFAVARHWRRRNVGVQMVGKLISKLSQQRRTRILLEVREGNLPAQVFFQKQGFRAIRVLRDYYDDSTEDAYRMEYRWKPTEEEPLQPINRLARLPW